MTATLGRVVLYKLSEPDTDAIVKARMAGKGEGNVVHPGDVYPALVVAVFPRDMVSLQVFLDGDHTLWAPSRYHGEDEGRWTYVRQS